MGERLRRLIREPLVQFVVLGAFLAVGLQWMRPSEEPADDRTILIGVDDVARLEAGWRARWSRPPTAEELEGLIRAQVREIAMHREALSLGLDRDEPVVRRVLVQKLQRIANNLVELGLAPTDTELESYYAANEERYRPAPVITFTQVFVDPDRREERTLPDAKAILEELQSRPFSPEEVDRLGDSFMLERRFVEQDESRIARLFGGEFARSVFELETGQWHGPVLSGYGTHLVFAESLEVFPTPPLDDVRERVTQNWVDERRREITEEYFEEILARYDVVIEQRTEGKPTDAESASAR